MNAIMVDTWDYTSEVAHGKSARKAESKRKELVRTSKAAVDRVKKMKDFEGNTEYRDSVISFLDINYRVLSHDYEKILNMEEIAEQSYDAMEAYLLAQELADATLDQASERMQEQQRKFAAANNINLVENKDKVAKKLEKAGDVIKHYNEVYLIFFKSYKQEAYMIDAMNRKDINAMEQNKNALISTTTESLEKLTKVAPYKNDKSLVNSCKSALEFYKTEASTKMDGLIYMQQEKFDKIRTSFEAKPSSKRTKEDTQQYNDAVNVFNSALKAFTKTNDELNKNRSNAIEKWNNSAKNYMDKHIPKYK